MKTVKLDKASEELLYAALIGHDGHSLRPDWEIKKRIDLTRALDRLRSGLYDESFDVSHFTARGRGGK